MYKQISANRTLSVVLIGFFLIILIGIGWFFTWYYHNFIYLIFISIIALVQAFVSYWWSDSISLSLAGAKPASRKEYLSLHRAVENMAILAGIPKPKVYVVNDPAPNAFATGRDPKHASLAITTGLLEIMNKRQLEGVISHEMSHIGNRDTLVMTMVVVLVIIIAWVSDLFIRMQWFRGNRDRNEGGGILIIIGIIGLILAPIVAQLVKLAISRKREYLADATGALMTRFPEGLAEALEKIKDKNSATKNTSTATSHLYIANPFKRKDSNWMSNLFATHPPIEDRIKKLREMI